MIEKELSEMLRGRRVFDLKPDDFVGGMRQSEAKAIFTHFGAFWQYEGEPRAARPHALLKSGLHSNGFIVCKDVLKYPKLCLLFAHAMLWKMSEDWNEYSLRTINVVASSAYSAINLGWEVSRLLSDCGVKHIEYVPVEKDDKGNPTVIRGGIDPDKTVLIINELMTTGTGSTWETKRAVMNCNEDKPAPQILEPVFVLVHRSKDIVLADGSKVKSVFHFDIENFKSEECPYCKAGSQAIKPKVGNNWQLLQG